MMDIANEIQSLKIYTGKRMESERKLKIKRAKYIFTIFDVDLVPLGFVALGVRSFHT